MAKNVQIIPNNEDSIGLVNFTETGTSYTWRLFYKGNFLYFEETSAFTKVLSIRGDGVKQVAFDPDTSNSSVSLIIPIHTSGTIPTLSEGQIIFDRASKSLVMGTSSGNASMEGVSGQEGVLGPIGP